MCAFRHGMIRDAHDALVDIQYSQRSKELLAQGLVANRGRTPSKRKWSVMDRYKLYGFNEPVYCNKSYDLDAVPHAHRLRINGVCLPDISLHVDRSTIFGTNSP